MKKKLLGFMCILIFCLYGCGTKENVHTVQNSEIISNNQKASNTSKDNAATTIKVNINDSKSLNQNKKNTQINSQKNELESVIEDIIVNS